MKQKTDEKPDKNLCRMVTPKFRVSYPHVFKPQAPDAKSKPKYSITMLFPKDQEIEGTSPDGKPRTLARIIRNAKVASFGPDKEEWPKLESPIQDGDDPKFEGKDGYKGHWVVKATTSEEQAPSVVGPDMKPLVKAADLYPGCYARAYIFAYCWEYMKKRGVGLILDHVQKLGDGAPFGGKRPVEQVFTPVEVDEDDSGDDDDDDNDEGFE